MIANIVIVLIIAALIIPAAVSTVKHFRGESSCCGGGSESIEIKKELDGPEIGEKTVNITGMKCDNCRINVQNALNRIDGVKAHVDLKKKTARISFSKEVPDSEIKRAVETAGYKVG